MVCRRYSGRLIRPIMPFEKIVHDEKDNVIGIVENLPLREDNKTVMELDVDQFSGQEFMLNSNGFITNDIMMFEECQSDSVARSVLQRLKVLHPQNIDQNMTLNQMMASSIPANYGSPAEFVSANKSIVSKLYKMRAAEIDAYNQRIASINAQKVAQESKDLEGSIPKSE